MERILAQLLCLAVCLAPLPARNVQSDTTSLLEAFLQPPHDARPQVWWHWMDGNVSKEGIRKDLEWMKRSGIGGFHQFDAGGINMPRAAKVRLPYLSEEWKDAFRFALKLADSLGLDVTIASAPGWSSTGGIWVTPEDALKKLEWRTLDTEGGKVRVRLPELYRTVGPYQDVFQGNDRIKVEPYGRDLFVIAVKRLDSDVSMEEMGAAVKASESEIMVTFRKPRTIKSLTLQSRNMGGRPRSGAPEFTNILEASDDGRTWHKVAGISPARIPYMTENIPPTRAKFFRVRGRQLVSLELFTTCRLNHSEELAGFSQVFDFGKYHTAGAAEGIPESQVIDLTGRMSPDGTLGCTLPEGRWRIYRFGWSITGKTNHPASPEATGLEVDKLDEEAWMRYFRNYLDCYKEASGGMLGSKGIRYLLTDSYEAGSFTWTPRMREQFLARRGYDLLPWLPVLTGQVIGSASRSEQFLRDWRKTLGELFCENYRRIGDLVHEYGLAGHYCETHEGGRAYTGDGMDPKISSDIPMGAIWMEDTPTGSAVPAALADIKESASAAHLYGKKYVAAESFTVNGDEGRAYTYCPENMKYIADRALSAGLNRFVIHESASQPNDAYLPGLQLFRYGQWFHRNETWSGYARVFTDYLARSCALLQLGLPVADVLLYYGEDSNVTALYGGPTFDLLPQVPAGYDYDFANPTALMDLKVDEKARELVAPSGARYKVLWLDKNHDYLSEGIRDRIEGFKKAGITVCYDEGLSSALGDLAPDFKAPAGFCHVHRQTGHEDIYWIRNFSGRDTCVTLDFRCKRRFASILNPENGKVHAVDGTGPVKLDMLSTDAFFVVFSDAELPMARALPAASPARLLKTIDGPWKVHFEQKHGGVADEVFNTLGSWTECADPVVKYFAGTAGYATTFELGPEDLSGPGEVVLDLGSVKNIAEVTINGKPAGILWKAPFRTENVKELLLPGINSLEVKVTNLWRNRMIGDVQPEEKHPVTAIRRFYKASDVLLPSGLLGPVGFYSAPCVISPAYLSKHSSSAR